MGIENGLMVSILGRVLSSPTRSNGTRGVRSVAIPRYGESLPRLAWELRRARRYEHTLTVLVLGPARRRGRLTALRGNGDGNVHQGGTVAERLDSEVLLLGEVLRASLRETDLLAYADESEAYAILLPESTERDALLAALRFERMFAAQSTSPIQAGVAEFPRDGFTVEDLLQTAVAGLGAIATRVQAAVDKPKQA